jgi:hypothetical protein
MACGYIQVYVAATQLGTVVECPVNLGHPFNEDFGPNNINSPCIDCACAHGDPTTVWVTFDIDAAGNAIHVAAGPSCP